MTLEKFIESARLDTEPPEELDDGLKALWLAKKGRWHESHEIAQDMHSPLGSWIHGLLHTIEGDLGNAGYWYARAGRQAIDGTETDSEWEKIAGSILSGH